MKINYYIILFFLVTSVCLSQPDDFRSLMDQYSGVDGFVVINLNDPAPILKDLVKSKSGRESIKTIKKIMMVSFATENVENNKTALERGKIFNSTVRKYRPSGYDEIMYLSVGKNSIRAYFKHNEGDENEFIMTVAKEDNNCLIMYMNGAFTKEQIMEIAQSISKNM